MFGQLFRSSFFLPAPAPRKNALQGRFIDRAPDHVATCPARRVSCVHRADIVFGQTLLWYRLPGHAPAHGRRPRPRSSRHPSHAGPVHLPPTQAIDLETRNDPLPRTILITGRHRRPRPWVGPNAWQPTARPNLDPARRQTMPNSPLRKTSFTARGYPGPRTVERQTSPISTRSVAWPPQRRFAHRPDRLERTGEQRRPSGGGSNRTFRTVAPSPTATSCAFFAPSTTPRRLSLASPLELLPAAGRRQHRPAIVNVRSIRPSTARPSENLNAGARLTTATPTYVQIQPRPQSRPGFSEPRRAPCPLTRSRHTLHPPPPIMPTQELLAEYRTQHPHL